MDTLTEVIAEQQDVTITPRVLKTLDYLVPGEYDPTISLEHSIRKYTGATDPALITAVGTGATQLYDAEGSKYRRAMRVYSGVDTLDKVVAAAALASKVGELFNFGGLFAKLTPKADTTQAVDAALKLVAEMVAYSLLHGKPKLDMEGVKQYTSGLSDYLEEDRMRFGAWIVIDGVLPLGPDFVQVIGEKVSNMDLSDNRLFKVVSGYLPSGSPDEQAGFIANSISAVQGWVGGLVDKHDLTSEKIGSTMSKVITVADGGLDYVSAALDASTNYFEYTGTQTVLRHLVVDSYTAHTGAAPVMPEPPAEDQA